MAALSLKLAQGKGHTGSGFNCDLRGIVDVREGRKGKGALVLMRQGKHHKRANGKLNEVVELRVVGDWKRLRARWKALLSAQRGGS